MEFKKRKEKTYEVLDESRLDEYTDEEITEFLIRHYPIGCIVDQATAYDVVANKDYIREIKSNIVSISRPNDGYIKYTNIAVNNIGVWSNSPENRLKGILAKKVKE